MTRLCMQQEVSRTFTYAVIHVPVSDKNRVNFRRNTITNISSKRTPLMIRSDSLYSRDRNLEAVRQRLLSRALHSCI